MHYDKLCHIFIKSLFGGIILAAKALHLWYHDITNIEKKMIDSFVFIII